MYGCDEEDLDALEGPSIAMQDDAELAENRAIEKNVTVSNPWVLAKMHARPTQRQVDSSVGGIAQASPSSSSTTHGNDAVVDDPEPRPPQSADIIGLLTPRASSPRPARQPFHPSGFVPDIRFANDGRLISSEPSDTERNVAGSSPTRRQMTPVSSQFGGTFRPINTATSNMVQHDRDIPLAQIPQARPRGRAPQARGVVNRPFVAPTAVGPPKERVWFEHLDDIENTRPRRSRRPHGTQHQHKLVAQGELGDLIDDPQPLSRAAQNRDIRDFVDTVTLTEGHDAATVRGHDNRALQMSRRSNGVTEPSEGLTAAMGQSENASQAYGALSGRGFMPASELATLEALGFAKINGQQPTAKRRKTAERALRPTSGNAPPNLVPVDENEDEYEPVRPRTKSGRRRSSIKQPRTKSSNLPLERTPAGRRTYDLALTSSISLQDIVVAQRRCETEHTLLDWSRSAVDLEDTFATIESHDEIAQLGRKVRELLINCVNDGDMVQDLGELIGTAFSRHREAVIDDFMSSSAAQMSEA
nr:hypothetical protein B0A51_06107 [Rachicladosporium sp. CCFEE 5018]